MLRLRQRLKQEGLASQVEFFMPFSIFPPTKDAVVYAVPDPVREKGSELYAVQLLELPAGCDQAERQTGEEEEEESREKPVQL